MFEIVFILGTVVLLLTRGLIGPVLSTHLGACDFFIIVMVLKRGA